MTDPYDSWVSIHRLGDIAIFSYEILKLCIHKMAKSADAHKSFAQSF